MGVEDNRKNQLRFYEAFNERDIDTIRQLLADDFVDHMVPDELGLPDGPARTVGFVQVVFAAFPDVTFEVEDMVAEGELVATRARLSGTHHGEFLGVPASGNRFELETGDFNRFDEDSKCVEHWGFLDNLALMQQLGAIPSR